MVNIRLTFYRYPNISNTDFLITALGNFHNLKILGSFFPEDLSLTDDDFYDGMHLKPSGFEKLLQYKEINKSIIQVPID